MGDPDDNKSNQDMLTTNFQGASPCALAIA
jgi:hypothetical protein